jgi:hypothetical protein
MKIEAKELGIKYKDFNGSVFQIAPSFDMNIYFEKINYTPKLEDQYQSRNIDF